MWQRTLKIIVVLLFFNPCSFVLAQKLGGTLKQATGVEFRLKYGQNTPIPVFSQQIVENLGNISQLIPYNLASSLFNLQFYSPNNKMILPGSFYASCLGIICRQELLMDHRTPVALRFRLGSLDYVNAMEMKGSSYH